MANKGFTDLLVLHYDENDKESQFLVVQCKRLSKEASTATWDEAKNQLKRYLPGLKRRDKKCPVYGVIAIGRFVQFVEYHHKLANTDQDPLKAVNKQTEKLHIGLQCETVTGTFKYIQGCHHTPQKGL